MVAEDKTLKLKISSNIFIKPDQQVLWTRYDIYHTSIIQNLYYKGSTFLLTWSRIKILLILNIPITSMKPSSLDYVMFLLNCLSNVYQDKNPYIYNHCKTVSWKMDFKATENIICLFRGNLEKYWSW